MATLAANRIDPPRRVWFVAALVLVTAGTAYPIYLSGSVQKWETSFAASTPHFYFDVFIALLALWPFKTIVSASLRISIAISFAVAGASKILLWEEPQLAGILPFVIVASEYFGLLQFLRYCLIFGRPTPAPTRIWRVVLLVVSLATFGVGMFYALVLPGRKGVEAIERKQYGVAIRYLTAEIWLSPVDNPDSFLQRGRAYYLAGRNDRALADFDTGIRLSPDYANAYLWRGSVLLLEDRQSRAIADFSEAIRLDPSSGFAYKGRGIAYLDRGDYQRAINDLDTATRLDPSMDVYRSRAVSYFRLGEFDHAIGDLDEAIRRKPNDAWAYYLRGITYSAKGDQERAAADFQNAIRIASEALHANARDARAHEAIAWMLATCPQPDRRDGKRAIEYARKAADLTEWKKARVLDALATSYAEAGDFDDAVKWEQKAIALADEPQPPRHERLDLFKQKLAYHEK
ncbi:MAG: tetratricopeptide repeat protein [Candidatus Binatus sp.]|uniref:tetratricopeptide repeat protein n=1 Tax=Candidatus Binatus sp. TaxID=2811406 RepID=UPI0027231332|nr:tetratricopeptide repeat protein [Candidatus Binatus sp.]MDO8433178.1 tetratricopeptide repeat protein [Candidatus Binatus sp.]